MSDVLSILPPSGPFFWLHPEATRATRASQGEMDLDAVTLRGEALAQDIRRRAPGEVGIEKGPRGDALAAMLRRRLSGSGIRIERTPRRRDLHVVLEDAARTLGPGLCVRVAAGDHYGDSFTTEVLTLEEAGSIASTPGAPCWIPVRVFSAGDQRAIDRQVAMLAAMPPAPWRGTVLPYFLAPPAELTTSIAGTFEGATPRVDPGPGCRESVRRLVSLIASERRIAFLALEHAALAGLDPFARALEGDAPPAATPAHRALIVAIEGTDGSGKSSHAQALAASLSERGLRVAVHKIYRHGVFHDTVTDLNRQSTGGGNLHLWRIERLAKIFDSVKYFHRFVEPDLDAQDVLVFDRYVETHVAAATGRLHDDVFATELLAVYPRPQVCFLLDLPVEDALARIASRGERTIDENAPMLERYRRAFLRFAPARGFRILDARAPFDENQRAMRVLVDDALAPSKDRL